MEVHISQFKSFYYRLNALNSVHVRTRYMLITTKKLQLCETLSSKLLPWLSPGILAVTQP